MPDAVKVIYVTLLYAEPAGTWRAQVELAEGATVADAIKGSSVRKQRPDIEIREERLGVFSRKARFDTVLHDGDRLEIYRPLKLDPKEARRQRARGEGC